MNTFIQKLNQNALFAWLFWIILSFIVFGNTMNHEFILDDGLLITENEFVKKGVSSIPQIFAHSHTYGATGIEDSGYRPIPLTIFALFISVFGMNPLPLHLLNIILFGAVVSLFNKFLINGFNGFISQRAAFFTSLLFLVHPIHSEVVANIKALEDILQFGFSMLMLIYLVDYIRTDHSKSLIISLSSFFLALLSKEIGFMMMGVVVMYLFVYSSFTKIQALKISGYFALVIVLGFFIRQLTIGDAQPIQLSILNNALVESTSRLDQLFTALWIQVKYIVLFFVPYHLSFDYSFNQIPIVSGFEIKSIVALMGTCLFISMGVLGIIKRKIWGFGLMFYAITILPVSNIFFLVGSTMAERFVFTASAGLCIGVVSSLDEFYGRKKLKLNTLILTMVILAFSGRTVLRNKDWKNDLTLFRADVINAPNSTRTHMNLGNTLLQQSSLKQNSMQAKSLLLEAENHLAKSVQILPSNYESHYNLGVVKLQMGKTKEAVSAFEACIKAAPEYGLAHNNLGVIYFNSGQFDLAETSFNKAYETQSNNADVLCNMGLIQFQNNHLEEAIDYFQKSLAINPNHSNALHMKSLAEKKSTKILEIGRR